MYTHRYTCMKCVCTEYIESDEYVEFKYIKPKCLAYWMNVNIYIYVYMYIFRMVEFGYIRDVYMVESKYLTKDGALGIIAATMILEWWEAQC